MEKCTVYDWSQNENQSDFCKPKYTKRPIYTIYFENTKHELDYGCGSYMSVEKGLQ